MYVRSTGIGNGLGVVGFWFFVQEYKYKLYRNFSSVSFSDLASCTRSKMFISAYLKEIRRYLEVNKRVPGLLPYVYSSKYVRVGISCNRKFKKSYRISLFFGVLNIVLMGSRLATQTFDIFRTITSLRVFVGSILALALRWNWRLETKFVNAINQMTNFEKRFLQFGYSQTSGLKTIMLHQFQMQIEMHIALTKRMSPFYQDKIGLVTSRVS